MSIRKRTDDLGPHIGARSRPKIGPLASASTNSTLFDHGLPYSMYRTLMEPSEHPILIRISRKLRAHSSCINALGFSSKDGRFLASGGDDLYIHLWDFHQEDITEPCHTFVGPRVSESRDRTLVDDHSTLFTPSFDARSLGLLVRPTNPSGGTDTLVHQYDVSRIESGSLSRDEKRSTRMFRENDTIRDITCSPFHDEIFLSGSDNGRIVKRDARLSNSTDPRAADTIQLNAEVTSVKFHPTIEHLFITSDSKSNVCLRDSRMAFGPRKSRSNEGIVRTFHTIIARRNIRSMSNPEPSSLTFDREGQKLAVTSLNYYPTIYSLSDPYPVAVCTGNSVGKLPGQRTYSNSCTMKHGCFGGPNPGISDVDYYCGGSDDFCAYLWRVPAVEQMIAQRDEIPAHEWRLDGSNTVGFTENLDSSKFIPTEISSPSAILKGHKSIVNTALIHPQFPFILTAGIECAISLHSPFLSCPFSRRLLPTSQETRQLPSSSTREENQVIDSLLLGIEPADRESSDEAELDTIRLFDRILRMEGEADPFEVRPWVETSEDEISSDTDPI